MTLDDACTRTQPRLSQGAWIFCCHDGVMKVEQGIECHQLFRNVHCQFSTNFEGDIGMGW